MNTETFYKSLHHRFQIFLNYNLFFFFICDKCSLLLGWQTAYTTFSIILHKRSCLKFIKKINYEINTGPEANQAPRDSTFLLLWGNWLRSSAGSLPRVPCKTEQWYTNQSAIYSFSKDRPIKENIPRSVTLIKVSVKVHRIIAFDDTLKNSRFQTFKSHINEWYLHG